MSQRKQTQKLRYTTSASDGFFRRLMSPLSWVIFGLTAVLVVSLPWFVVTVAQVNFNLAGWLVILAAAPVTAWAVLESLWRPDKESGVVGAAVQRACVVPFVTVPVLVLLSFAASVVPAIRQRFESHPWPTNQYESEWTNSSILPTDGTSIMSWLAFLPIAWFFSALMAGLAIAVVVVAPVSALFTPERFIQDNKMSAKAEDRRRNTVAVRAMVFIVPLAFLSSGVKVAEQGSGWWWIGVAALVGLVAVVYFIWATQRVDHKARAKMGAFRGVPNPADPNPDDARR
ncbi:hypothetical protein IEU95_08550 [Hoyosella rhizosphaerae]|uniref:Transmembrane protein n=1 Tax=Hoyosella rhizosphaerae TaxID=1755582 RepID=A0A916U0J5_9ACTN|nr:hypothetical protein [Hoyosella rhizosphaerae]MBN4926878.1 hypothetical protein [Hoyosella rhizosphaerae]GGC55793.1 hypothetical protein GCM10011410_05260 [Hoyosella rhizosphaerae]